MSNYLLFAIAVIVLFYIATWLGVSMLMATMTEFAEYQNRAYQWPAGVCFLAGFYGMRRSRR